MQHLEEFEKIEAGLSRLDPESAQKIIDRYKEVNQIALSQYGTYNSMPECIKDQLQKGDMAIMLLKCKYPYLN